MSSSEDESDIADYDLEVNPQFTALYILVCPAYLSLCLQHLYALVCPAYNTKVSASLSSIFVGCT